MSRSPKINFIERTRHQYKSFIHSVKNDNESASIERMENQALVMPAKSRIDLYTIILNEDGRKAVKQTASQIIEKSQQGLKLLRAAIDFKKTLSRAHASPQEKGMLSGLFLKAYEADSYSSIYLTDSIKHIAFSGNNFETIKLFELLIESHILNSRFVDHNYALGHAITAYEAMNEHDKAEALEKEFDYMTPQYVNKPQYTQRKFDSVG